MDAKSLPPDIKAPNLTVFSTNIWCCGSTAEFDWLGATCPNLKVLLIPDAVEGLHVKGFANFPNLEILDISRVQFADYS